MTENTNGGDEQINRAAAEQAAIQALGSAIGQNFNQIVTNAHNQYVSTVALGAIVACLPGTADIDPQQLGAVIGALSRGRPDEDEFRQQVSNLAARAIMVAREARAAAVKAAAAEAAGAPAH